MNNIELVNVKKLGKYTTLNVMWVISLILIIITFLVAWFQARNAPIQAVLRYNVITGVDVFGPYYLLYFIPLASAVIIAINFFISKFLKMYKEFLPYVLAGATLMTSLIGLLASLLLLWLN